MKRGGAAMRGATSLALGEVTVHWLPGGDFWLDGGTLFATVPKKEWQCVRPAVHDNTLRLCNDPLLIESNNHLIVVDTGLGGNLSASCLQSYRVSSPWALVQGLEALGVGREEIDHVVLTHGDFDHTGGLTMDTAAAPGELTFPRAMHHLQRAEWEEMNAPHRRSAEAYDNNALALIPHHRLHLVDGADAICPGITLRLSGGHTRGHQVVEIRSGNHLALHLGDLLPTHNHAQPLWHLSYDNEPLTVIDRKVDYLQRYEQERPWFLLYHDPFVRACRLDRHGAVEETWPVSLEEVAKTIRDDFSGAGKDHSGKPLENL